MSLTHHRVKSGTLLPTSTKCRARHPRASQISNAENHAADSSSNIAQSAADMSHARRNGLFLGVAVLTAMVLYSIFSSPSVVAISYAADGTRLELQQVEATPLVSVQRSDSGVQGSVLQKANDWDGFKITECGYQEMHESFKRALGLPTAWSDSANDNLSLLGTRTIFITSNSDCFAPSDFKGVIVYLDGETGQIFSGWNNEQTSSTRRALYLGPLGIFLKGAQLSALSNLERIPRSRISYQLGASYIAGFESFAKPPAADLLKLVEQKDGFAIYLNHHCLPYREEAFNRVFDISKTHPEFGAIHSGGCSGSHSETKMPNLEQIYRGVSRDEANRKLFQKYKFVMCMESHPIEGYVTEKLVNAFLGFAVPVYFGGQTTKDIFQKDSFIFYDIANPDTALSEILYLSQNKTAYLEKLMTPVLMVKATEDFFWNEGGSKAAVAKAMILSMMEPEPQFQIHAVAVLPPTSSNDTALYSFVEFANSVGQVNYAKVVSAVSATSQSDLKTLERPWLLKPKMANKVLSSESVKIGDVVILVFNEMNFIGSASVLARIAREADVMVFCEAESEGPISRSAMMTGSDDHSAYALLDRRSSDILVLKKSEKALELLKEWDSSSEEATNERSVDMILSMLTKKKKYPCWRKPYGDGWIDQNITWWELTRPGDYGAVFGKRQ